RVLFRSLDGSGSATAPGKSPLATSCAVDSYLGLVLLAKATSSHVSVLSLQKAIAFSVSTTVVLNKGKKAAIHRLVRNGHVGYDYAKIKGYFPDNARFVGFAHRIRAHWRIGP